MTNLDELKNVIAETWRDEEMASSACHGVDAYSKLWPYVFMVNDWLVWDESGRGLSRDVLSWLEGQGSAWDFYHLMEEWGLVGFADLRTATRFRQRWFGAVEVVSSSGGTWNPHPLNTSFAPGPMDEVPMPVRRGGRTIR